MKKTKLTLAILFALLISAFCFSLSASAATEKESFTLDSACNVIVDITYDTDSKPAVSLVSPKNKTYSEHNQTDGVVYECDESLKRICFYVSDAAKGTWNVTYDASLKGHLTVNTIKFARNIEIESFHLNSVNGNQANVDFTVNFPKKVSYSYTINAVVLDANGNIEGKRSLYSSTAYSGQKITRSVSLSSLQSYDAYYLLLEVSYEDYDTEVTDSAISDKFSFTNSNTYAPITGYTVTFNATTGELTVDWNHCYIYNATAYNVAVEADGETVYADTLVSSVRSVQVLADPSATEIKVSLSYKRSNNLSQIHTVTVHPADMGISIATGNLTNSSQAEINYSVNAQYDAYITVNESVNEQVMLNGSGSFSVPLEEGYNNLCVKQVYSENIIFIAENKIFLDRFAPIIEFYENLSNVTTAETLFVIVGEVESGCSFTVNGANQPIAADGSFSISLTLSYGVNTFEFLAIDGAGNQTARTVSIVCTAKSSVLGISLSTELLIFAGVGIALVLSALISLLVMKKKKKLNRRSLLALLFWILIVITVALAVVMISKLQVKARLGNVVNGTQFFEIAKESIDEADRYLTAYENAKKVANRYILFTAISAAVSVLVLVVLQILKKKNKDNDPTSHAEEPEAEAEAAPTAEPTPVVESAPAADPTPVAAPTPVAEPAPTQNTEENSQNNPSDNS